MTAIRISFAALLCLLLSCTRERSAERHNVLLITIDTIRADRVGAYGYSAAQTPALDALAGDGIRFEQAIAVAPLTLPSHCSILSGLLPLHHGVRNNGSGRFPDEAPSLASHLSAAGYRTAAFVGSFVLDRRFGLSRGFDIYDDEIPRDPSADIPLEAERTASVTVDRAVQWLGTAAGRPFFLWVHLYDPHAPYLAPEPFRSEFAGRDYDGEIAYTDAQIARLITRLRTIDLFQNTLIVVAGDHGEALGAHGELTHGLLVYEPTLRTPLVIRHPRIARPGVVKAPVSLADVAPTIAGLLGHKLPGKIDGRDLSSQLLAGKEPPASDLYSESEYPTLFGWSSLVSIRRGDLKFIDSSDAELYDLRRDPAETTNRRDSRRRDLHQLAAALRAIRQTAVQPTRVPVDEETRSKLASLGYVAPAAVAKNSLGENPRDKVGVFRRFEEANQALLANRYDAAVSAFEDILRQEPGNPIFRGSLARALRQRGQLDRAIQLYRETVALIPEDPEAWYNLGVALQETAEYEEAIVVLKESVRLDTRRPEAHNALGICLTEKGDLLQGISHFQQAIALDPRNARALNNLGNAFRALGRIPEAESAYRRAVELAPRYGDPWNGLGVIEVQRGRPHAAVALFDRVLQLDPDFHEARLNRGIALQLSGRRAEAVREYRYVLAKVSTNRRYAEQRRAAQRLLADLGSP